jgi:hypothetical protein
MSQELEENSRLPQQNHFSPEQNRAPSAQLQARSSKLTSTFFHKTIVVLKTFSYLSYVDYELVLARLSRTAFFVEDAFGSSDRTRLQSQTRGAG